MYIYISLSLYIYIYIYIHTDLYMVGASRALRGIRGCFEAGPEVRRADSHTTAPTLPTKTISTKIR